MKRVLDLALKGRGSVSPNPRVGALISDADGRILGKGFHQKYGEAHAEVKVFNACQGMDLSSCTLYVNLEPCCHSGKTPPCTEAIINSGIKRVVIGNQDTNPKVNGRGIDKLRKAGLDVTVGVLSEEGWKLNRGYFCQRSKNRAWCTVKIALSIDGKMANFEGVSKWITGEESRELAHRLRADHDSILVGGNTVQLDNPRLNTRKVDGPSPARIVLSPHQGIPKNSKIYSTSSQIKTILITSDRISDKINHKGDFELLELPEQENGRINPKDLLERLVEFNILSVLVEGGSRVLTSFLEEDVIDELYVGVASTIIGKGIAPFEDFIPQSWENRPRFMVEWIKRFGTDTVIKYIRGENKFSQD